MQENHLWFKDAIIYQLHVKSFYDSNADGYGDFHGLIKKLPYLQDLGINCIWLLPFYKSPLKDDGYDISDYRSILPEYGLMRDFRKFVREAHKRNIRVLIELVMNHTSDQHAWFQDARTSIHSKKRNFYVWNDTPDKYKKARIVFGDTEKSNWTYEPDSRQYYWHRFFSHQPDLNFDNPIVVRTMLNVLSFWLKSGVDGFRLDAVPYLYEREGTDCENLPQTHVYLKALRERLDKSFKDRIFLAEANLRPEDVCAYFGKGDECHMAFHFPLMPRLFMAIRKEENAPIIDIMRKTPKIPDNCQWAVFLRNHDELTLETVTPEEREFMYQEYAADPRSKINVGIRRRLAPLLDNDQRQMELLNSLLLTLTGSPIIYYGDELGMGDNIYLGDRHGVRTPMQWNGERNAGFSSGDTARLYAPVVVDSIYGYQTVNVENQLKVPTSFLNGMKRMIKMRKKYYAFGRGELEFLSPKNSKLLAYIRSYKNEVLLIVNNLSKHSQPLELDLKAFNGWTPVELMGGVKFPPIGVLPYFLTLGPHGFYWFELCPPAVQAETAAPVKTNKADPHEK